MDKRIGTEFLKVSPGFGGSCFKKDILNLVYLCQHYDLNEIADYWKGVLIINDFQRSRIFNIVNTFIKKYNLKKEVSILGWAFKKNTDDSRESSSIYVASNFLKEGYTINIYDPKVKNDQIKKDLVMMKHTSKDLNQQINFFNSLESITSTKSPLLIMTEWDEFKSLNTIKHKLRIFDFRNILNNSKLTYRF